MANGTHQESVAYRLENGRLQVRLKNGIESQLSQPDKLQGYVGSAAAPEVILLRNNGLHAEIHINPAHPIGKSDPAGVSDIVLESAITTIQDFEDSVAAVDATDKALVYANWFGLMKGNLVRKV